MRRSKTFQKKAWITLKELSMFHRLVIWVSQTAQYSSALILLNQRIVNLVRSNGFWMTFQYLKESLRLTIRAISGSPEPKVYISIGVRVSRDSHGLPTIIPLSLRRLILDPKGNVNVVRAVLTLISCFRTFPTPVKPDLGTIINPFSGLAKTLPKENLIRALKTLRVRASVGSFKGFISESAGPNSHVATWGAGIDALAFIHYPKQLLGFIHLALLTKSYGYLIQFIGLILWAGPVYLVLVGLRLIRPLHLGRLSIVYDQAGKARVVAITNWWIQLCLKPLHESIFDSLRRIPTDGTFDQTKPLDILLSNGKVGHKFYSFDLTAATDRLPIDLQVDILDTLGVPGSLWRSLLSFSWFYRSNYISYSVGQPMGAYSSWAMLALTHHVIVQVSAQRAGVSNFTNYAVLGDDIVINDDNVASEYLKLMELLGVSINLGKSIVSKDTVEFAKRWKTSEGIDYSPIGPGLILACMRKPITIGAMLTEAANKGYATNSSTVLSLIRSLPNFVRSKAELGVWAAFGVSGSLQTGSQVDMKMLTWCSTHLNMRDPHLIRYSYYNGILQLLVEDIRKAVQRVELNEEIFYRNWWKVSAQSLWPNRLIEVWTSLFAPGFWLYASSFVLTREDQETSLKALLKGSPGTWSDIVRLFRLDPTINGNSIDWYDRKSVQNYASSLKRLEKAISQTYKDMDVLNGRDGSEYY
nr:MAG: putative RNA-dependent RNA polymerase [Mitoviridae sp.]